MKAVQLAAQIGWGRSRQTRRRMKWDEAAFWFRLRYPDAGQVQQSLNLISRHTDRLGFRFRVENGVSHLYIGVTTEAVAKLLEEMARDIGFSTTAVVNEPAIVNERAVMHESSVVPEPAAEHVPPPLIGRFTPAQHLVQASRPVRGVDAYLVREQLFILSDTEPDEKGMVFPEAVTPNGHGPRTWFVPEPVLGITTRPEWPAPAPAELALKDKGDWVLGQSPDGLTLGGRRVQVLGAADSTVAWFYGLILTRLARKQNGLVVIDGRGDLAPRLLSSPQVARLRNNKKVTYLDVNVAGQGGVNPLAAGPKEDLEQVVSRWRWWFSGMGVSGRALELLPQAVKTGVRDLPAMQGWLKSQNGDSFAAAASFRAVLEQLERNQVVYRWLTLYPAALRASLESGALFISCPHKGRWSRQQAIRAALAQAVGPGTDLVLHQAPLTDKDLESLNNLRIVIYANSPLPSHSVDTAVLTRHNADVGEGQGKAVLQLNGTRPVVSDAVVAEHVRCLHNGEALVARDGLLTFCGFGFVG